MVMVNYEAVRKRFGPVEVLKGIDLAVRRGEVVVLVGPSGCGKSTLLRVTAGLGAASGGRIMIDGRQAHDLPPHQRLLSHRRILSREQVLTVLDLTQHQHQHQHPHQKLMMETMLSQ